MRVVGGRGRRHSFAPARIACEQPCRARSEGEPKLARRCVVLGSATIRIKPVAGRFRFRLSTNRPKSRRKLVTPSKALVLAVSKSSARRDQFLWQQCMPFCAVDCCEGDLLFLCQPDPPLGSSNTTWEQIGMKTQSPCSVAQRACQSQDSGPQGCPMPHLVCLSLPLSRPSISVSGSQVST